MIEQHSDFKVDPKDIVFRFSRYGLQSDTAFVVCPSVQKAERLIHQFQEVAVPKSMVYGSLMGCSFLWASRSTCFLSSPALENALMTANKFCLLSFGWAQSNYFFMSSTKHFFEQIIILGEFSIAKVFVLQKNVCLCKCKVWVSLSFCLS